MRAVLVHCPPHGEVPFRHIGLAYLRAVLESERVETKLLDISASEGKAGTDFYDDIILYLSRSVGDVGDGLDPRLLMEVLHPDRFDEPSPLSQRIVERLDARFEEIAAAGDVFLLPVNIITYYFAAGLAHRLRAIGKRTAAGGPSTHFAPIRDLLLRCGSFDAVVEGEGEGIVVPLVRALGGAGGGAIQGLGSLPGVAFFDGTQVHATPAAPPPALESLPDPHFEADEVRDFVPILAARGCSARCSYCSEPFNWVRHRRREPEAVLAEMDRAAKRWGVVNFHFHDDMINGNLPWFDRLLDLLIEGD
ncbi:MAG: radical SAM protein, partial [Myxococcales bacterium]|nr:radical SAM protein [Myxococcales bacterium]